MAENQKTNLATVRFSSGVGNTLQIKFPEVVSSQKDNTKYIYYTKEGDFLGGNENSSKVYITTQEEYNKSKNKWSLINKEENLLKLFDNPISHKDFLSYAGIIHGEASSKDSVSVGIPENELKEERYCLGNAIYNFMKKQKILSIPDIPPNYSSAKTDKTPGYISITESKPENRSDQWFKIAISSVINAITGGKDYSNGSTHWDGGDIFTGNKYNGYDPMKQDKQKHLYKEPRVIGIYDKNKLSNNMYNNLKNYYTKIDTHRAKHLKPLHMYTTVEHYVLVGIDPKDSSKLQTIDNEKPKVSYKWKDSTVELVSGPGIMKLTLYCLWEVRAQKACSIFYSQLNDRYPIQKSNANKK